MNHDRYAEDVRELRRRLSNMGLLVAILSVTLLMSLGVVVKIAGTERTIVAPPSITKTFWITHDRASSEYLEQMAAFSAWLILDVAPESIEWKKQTLLQYVDPDEATDLKLRQDVEAERLKKLNASTYFLLQQLVPDERNQSVRMKGMLRTQINGATTSTVEKEYAAQFEFRGGRVQLSKFEEVEDE